MKATTIIRLNDNGRIFEWQTGDGVFLGGSCKLGEGKTASSVSFELDDPRLVLANLLPLPLRRSRVPVEVWFGYGTALPKVFTGYMTSLAPSGLPGRLKISATDKAKGLRRVGKSRNLTQTDAGALFQKLVQEQGLTLDLSGANFSQVQFSSVLQMGESNMDVLERVARETGHDMYVRGDTVFVKQTGTTPAGRTTIIEFGQDVRNGFNFNVDELRRGTTPNVFDLNGAKVTDTGDLDDEAAERLVHLVNSGLTLVPEDVPEDTSQGEQRALKAQARARKLFTATMPLQEARPEVDVDWQAVLRGFGPRFSGAWNISAVDHDLTGGFTTLEIYNGGSNV